MIAVYAMSSPQPQGLLKQTHLHTRQGGHCQLASPAMQAAAESCKPSRVKLWLHVAACRLHRQPACGRIRQPRYVRSIRQSLPISEVNSVAAPVSASCAVTHFPTT